MMKKSLHRIKRSYFFQLSASQFISDYHFTESADNHFSLKNCLAELLLDSAENQLWELCQTGHNRHKCIVEIISCQHRHSTSLASCQEFFQELWVDVSTSIESAHKVMKSYGMVVVLLASQTIGQETFHCQQYSSKFL